MQRTREKKKYQKYKTTSVSANGRATHQKMLDAKILYERENKEYKAQHKVAVES